MSQQPGGFRTRLETAIFEADTPLGKLFDVALLWTIVLSIALVMLESVPSIRAEYGCCYGSSSGFLPDFLPSST